MYSESASGTGYEYDLPVHLRVLLSRFLFNVNVHQIPSAARRFRQRLRDNLVLNEEIPAQIAHKSEQNNFTMALDTSYRLTITYQLCNLPVMD
jgi:hypothetical protein